MRRLHEETVHPIAQPQTRGAWYRGLRLVSLDGSTLDVADTAANQAAFGRPGSSRGRAAFPQIRLAGLVENGTHVLFGIRLGDDHTGEVTLAREVIGHLQPGMLCLADRNFFSYAARESRLSAPTPSGSGASRWALPCHQRLPDGSYLSKIYPSTYARQKDREGMVVRVIEYTLSGIPQAPPLYRLVTTLLDPDQAPAEELAALYHERLRVETALDELKTHLRGHASSCASQNA